MAVRIHTGDPAADRILSAALPLLVLPDTGDVLFLGEETALAADPLLFAEAVLAFLISPETSSPAYRHISTFCPCLPLTPPLSLPVLQRLLSRHALPLETVGKPASVLLDPETGTLALAGREVHLTEREFALFTVLYTHAGETVSREALTASVWPEGAVGNVCQVYITYLRKKLAPLFGEDAIHSVRGKGYILRLPSL